MSLPHPPEDEGKEYPLGAPLRDEPDELGWVPVRGKPWLERHAVTGHLRTNLPLPEKA
jgi:hypothetical protein